MLNFLTQFLLDIFLDPSEHEGFEYGMKPVQLILFNISTLTGICLDVLGKPFLELFVIIEQLWHDEVEQGPELCHGILDRSPCEQ